MQPGICGRTDLGNKSQHQRLAMRVHLLLQVRDRDLLHDALFVGIAILVDAVCCDLRRAKPSEGCNLEGTVCNLVSADDQQTVSRHRRKRLRHMGVPVGQITGQRVEPLLFERFATSTDSASRRSRSSTSFRKDLQSLRPAA